MEIVVARQRDEQVDISLGELVRKRAAAAVKIGVQPLVKVVHQGRFGSDVSSQVRGSF